MEKRQAGTDRAGLSVHPSVEGDVLTRNRAQTLLRTISRSTPVTVRRTDRQLSAFSLIEVLVVVAILALLIGIVLASLAKVRASTRSFVCKNKLKTVAFDFIQFADDYAHPWRGDSDADGQPGFYVNDFQERLYGVAEFWKMGAIPQAGHTTAPFTQEFKPADHPMICPAGPQFLWREPNLTCAEGAIGPVENVTIGFNARLHRAPLRTFDSGGRPQYVWQDIRLTQRILGHPSVPLAFDVDGAVASVTPGDPKPYYTAPPVGDPASPLNGLWFPSMRHGGMMNVAFVGGHVLSSSQRDGQTGWDWSYQPSQK